MMLMMKMKMVTVSCLEPILNSTEYSELDNKYDTFRMMNGLPEGPEIFGMNPLFCNLDLLNYISFTKGCYIGQETVARAKFVVS